MKELSIEQKAKAYDEALRIAQELYNNPNSSNVGKGYVCTVFPELQESDNEKIRKTLIRFFKDNYPNETEMYDGTVTVGKALAWLEKQGEQKPADKVEPKFKAGDWVVTSYGKVNQVIAVDEDGDGFTLDDDTYFSGSWKDGYHLWTIQDAKDGDVLATPNYIYIFNSIDTETETVAFYCLVNKSDEHFCFGDYRIHDEILNSTPATKEQYDLLFSKMKEAGYEWDAEKKELKKISQRMVSAEAKEALYDKPAWSEEDDNCLSTIIAEFSKCSGKSVSKDEWMRCNDFLNSLKGRVQPQKQWKPSAGQMKALHDLNLAGNISYAGQGQVLIELYNDLKKLIE